MTGIELKDGTRPLAHGLLFHPDLIRGTALGRDIKRYSFFSYESNEALHLSEEEKGIFVDCLRKIQIELEHSIDKHSKRLIAMNIELLLDYCLRFKDRQFTTRAETNKDVLVRFERLLDEYLQSDLLRQEGLPTVRYFAEKICLSPNYFGDLIKKETGKTAQEKYTRPDYFLSERMDIRDKQDRQPNRLRPRIPILPAFQPHIQEDRGVYPE